MSFIKGALKVAKGVVNIAMGSAKYDGAPRYCGKCGYPHIGACPDSGEKGMVQLKEGLKEILV